MKKEPVISLCLPTNGIIEWVFPVLDSIYSQNVDSSLFEVIVTDNGDNKEFYNQMKEYVSNHENIIYKKTNAYMFANQLEALKLANGTYFKFINHRQTLTAGSLDRMIKIIKENEKDKPVIFFSDGSLKKEVYNLNSFDEFVAALGRYASWTTGVGIWKEDYKKIPSDVKYDKISPHSVILFSERKKNKYIIENFLFAKELTDDHSKKGKYDLFKAFAVEELTITLKLFVDGDITADTLKAVKEDYKKFLCELYWNFCIQKIPCSYDLTGFKDVMGIFFTEREIKNGACLIGVKNYLHKIKNIFVRK